MAGCEDISLWDIISAAFFGPPLQGAAPPLQEHAGGVLDDGFWGTVAAGIQLDGYPNDANSWTGHEFTFPLSTFWGQPVGPPVYLTVNVTVKVSYKL